MLPSLTGIEQARQRSKVVLPAPDLPMMATNSPGRMVAVTCSRACLASKRLLTRSSIMQGESSIQVSALVALPHREGQPAYKTTRIGESRLWDDRDTARSWPCELSAFYRPHYAM